MPRCVAGYDAMVFAGLQRFLYHGQREEIREDLLRKYGLAFSAGEVSALVRKFLQYLERLHKANRGEMRKALDDDGGYPLHVDATGEDGQGTLLVALAGWRRWILDAWKIPTERTEVLHPALRSVTDRFGAPCAAVRDLGKAMIPAVKKLVDELEEELGVHIPILSCHQHFLSDIGEDLLDDVHSELRAVFRHFKVRPKLAALARDLGGKLGDQVGEVRQEVKDWQERDEDGHVLPEGRVGLGAVRSLAQWVLDYKADTGDLGFPFDRPYLAFYDRATTIRRAIDACYRTPPADKSVLRTLDRLRRILDVVVSEPDFTDVTRRLRKRAALFDDLRAALRIVPKEGGRNVQPPRQPLSIEQAAAELNDVQQAVEAFVASLKKRRPERGPAQDMREAIDIILQHMEDHGDTLWGHVVRVSTPEGEVVRIVDRTNYVLETGTFGEMKRGERRRSGRKNLKQDLEHLPPAAAIARNLLRPDYVQVVCGSLENLPEAFAELDAERRKKRLVEKEPTPVAPVDDAIPQVASASLPADDRALVRSEAMRRRVLAAARSRAPRTRVRGAARGAKATVE